MALRLKAAGRTRWRFASFSSRSKTIADAAIATIMDNARRNIIIAVSFLYRYASEAKRLHQTCAYLGKSVVNFS
jgi:hypothetical protein